MTANTRVIRSERYVEIGAVIQENVGILIDRWARRATEEQPHARRVHHDTLLDHLPTFLHELASHLADEAEPDGGRHRRPARQHGEQRWEAGWSLTEVIRDYRILRLVLLEYLEETLSRPLRVREIQAVGLALDDAIEASVDHYVRAREQETKKLEDDLRQQTQALQEADRRKNEFLATLAHELRNPLAPLRTCLEFVRINNNDPATIQQIREMMDRQVHQLSRLVDDLLDVSRIAQGKLVLRKERFDLCSVLEQAAQMNAPFREARHHQFCLALPKTALWIEGDQARLVQVFVNLLNNAAKYTPDGGQIRMAAEQSEPGKAHVRLSDNGIGIASDMLPHIFDLFTQADFDTNPSQGGLGIGLTLVRRLVELHGGTISVESQGKGQGSEFSVVLPCVEGSSLEGKQEQNTAKRPVGRSVLLIEDHADSRESLALLLRLLGHQVATAANGQQGLAAAGGGLDVVLVDIGLPDLNGYDVGRKLRKSLGDVVLLVALTGYGQPEDRQKAIDAGFDVHLTKPVELDALQQLLNEKSGVGSA